MIRRPPRSTLFPYTTALPIYRRGLAPVVGGEVEHPREPSAVRRGAHAVAHRSEEHTSELQSQSNLVCRLLLEKKKTKRTCSATKTILRTSCVSCHIPRS